MTYVDVKFDKRLKWKHKTHSAEAQAKMKLNIHRKIAATKWVAYDNIITCVY
ncbi:hypothetical protein DPMN_115474 [Dreissena polymorpha]|uniref:Uncharacterized protein n=1 Tax=Dreissena polymorpha TaxID=45954 RepID=A0A9D4KLS5_DREPO|nr:hypothetical protein DPMN_115474 [Dreissena polymorpha]